MNDDENHKCDLLSLVVQFVVGGIVGSIIGILLQFSPRYSVLVEMPYSPYFVIACGVVLSGFAMLYGNRLWSADYIIPKLKPKHSRASRIYCWVQVVSGIVLAVSMLILSEVSKVNEEQEEDTPRVYYFSDKV